MSYCRGTDNAWISPKGWRAAMAWGAPRAAARAGATSRSATPHGRAAQAGDVLRVVAVERADGTLNIAGVSPDRGPAERGDSASPYILETRDASGKQVLASSRMTAEQLAHGDETALTGQVPAAGAAMVVVRREGGAITRRLRSPNAPGVRLLAPRRGTRVLDPLIVRWAATDRDGPGLTATVESSADGGRTWRVRHVGASRGRVALPVRDLAPSRRARIRVRVDDGFMEATAVSAPFVVPPSPPQVRILEPRRALSVRPDAPLVLRGEATAGGRRLTGRSLRWMQGRRQIGTGETVTLSQVVPGRHVIRLVASAGGRRATATVRIGAPPVRAQILVLRAPARVSAGARTVRLRIATTVRATVDAGRRRVVVDRRTRTVTLPIGPGVRSTTVRLRTPAGITRIAIPLNRQ
jgi:hypothetical protein